MTTRSREHSINLPDGALSALFRLVGVILIVMAAAFPAEVLAESSVAKDARLGGDKNRTRFVADLSKEVEFRLFTLADPYRVIVDLPDVKFQFPKGLGKKGRGLVEAYRFGLIASGKARIVIDLKAPALVDKAFIIGAKKDQPARLVIDLAKTDRATFLKKLKRAPASRPKKSAKGPGVVAPSTKRAKKSKPVVVIDPGHGGIDPGAKSKKGLKEKDIVFAFSKALRKRLRASGRYSVVLTREIDTYIPLQERVAFGRKKDADLFISIHADAIPGRSSNKISGATVYTLSEKASDAEAKALATKENLSDVIAGVELAETEDEVTGILIDLAMRETKNLSITFADLVLDELKGKTPLMNKAHRFAGFRVLKAPDVPSVLIELGYMTNSADTRNLVSKSWREKVSKAIMASIDEFFAARAHGMRPDAPRRKSSQAK